MNRRDAIKKCAALLGAAILAPKVMVDLLFKPKHIPLSNCSSGMSTLMGNKYESLTHDQKMDLWAEEAAKEMAAKIDRDILEEIIKAAA
jgi:hypothetical protein